MSTTALPNLDPVLARQLKKLGLGSTSPSDETWARFVAAVNDYYRHLNDDRALLARSIELSTAEMDALRQRLEGQRDQLSAVVDAIGEALGLFGAIEANAARENAGGLSVARREFSARLQTLFDDDGASDSAQISTIRTNLVRLADQVIRLLAETAEKAAIKKELEVARVVQSLLVPPEGVLTKSFMKVAGYFQPASECGGDWWCVSDLHEGRILTVIGDVTGHGISSAIITGAAKAACDLACHITKGSLSPGELLAMMNQAIHQTAKREIMMTCGAAIFDPASKQMTFANAGHHFPYHLHGGQVRSLMAQGQPLGATEGASYAPTSVDYDSGDLFVWFTDGVVECENDAGEQFSERRLRATCQRAAAGGASSVRDAVLEALTTFRRGHPQGDDITLVVASID